MVVFHPFNNTHQKLITHAYFMVLFHSILSKYRTFENIFYDIVTYRLYFSLQVRKSLAQVITAMAHNGYLNLEGGDQLVEFIVRQCSVDETAVGINLDCALGYC